MQDVSFDIKKSIKIIVIGVFVGDIALPLLETLPALSDYTPY
jgi:hypothetical protein